MTYAGAARFASAGTTWNALPGVENAVPSLQKEHLRTADGTRTAVADFGGVTGTWQTESGKFFAGSATNDHLVFVGVRADESGRIVGELHGGTVATGSGVFNGFQLVGTFPEDPTGLVFLVR